jgi:hypothetical protein
LNPDLSRRRLLVNYEERMTAIGLPGAIFALAGMYDGRRAMEARIKVLTAKVNAPQSGYSFFSGVRRQFENQSAPTSAGALQSWYRNSFSLETRLRIHRVLLARFVGPYEPPSE